MDRRRFLSLLGAGTAGLALADAIPFGRVWSFPTQLRLPHQLLIPPGASVRFIETWHALNNTKLARLDVLCGFPSPAPLLLIPPLVDGCQVHRNESRVAMTYTLPAKLHHVPGVTVGAMQRFIDQAGPYETAALCVELEAN